jgi:hypothetical protein
MIVFISSTYLDLLPERAAAQVALQSGQAAAWGMEFFYSQPEKPLDVCLNELRQCGALVLIVGFWGGSLVPGGAGLTYTAREIDEAQRLGIPVFSFIKTERGTWKNEEAPCSPIHSALNDLRNRAQLIGTVSYFESLDQLKFDSGTEKRRRKRQATC